MTLRAARVLLVDDTVIYTSAISGAAGILGAVIGALGSALVRSAETRQKRRSERQEAYLTAINLLTDWGWQDAFPAKNYDVVRGFSIPFVRASNAIRVCGSPASIAAIDEIQSGLVKLSKKDATAAGAIATGHDHLVMAARKDVGPRKADRLGTTQFRQGGGIRLEYGQRY